MCTMETNLESKNSTLPLESQQAIIEHPALFELIKKLIEIIEKQQQEITELRLEVKRLQDQLHLDSHNSSYPPSTDKSRTKLGKKVNNLRKSTTKKPESKKTTQEALYEWSPFPIRSSPMSCRIDAHAASGHQVKMKTESPPPKPEMGSCFRCPITNFEYDENRCNVED
ncbi:MAG: hypothetical protein PWP04_1075 [Candidatus Atribacteria bacterium]|nr:hypothetical protein [Candidatus Atribacteria bacterium]